MLQVEIVYVTNEQSLVQIYCELPDGSCVQDALASSELFVSHPEARTLAIGIFSKQVTVDTLLKNGDRIELYHPLKYDPKDNRRQRAKVKKSGRPRAKN